MTWAFVSGLRRESPSSRKVGTPLAISPGSGDLFRSVRRMMRHRSWPASYWPPLRQSIRERCKAALVRLCAVTISGGAAEINFVQLSFSFIQTLFSVFVICLYHDE